MSAVQTTSVFSSDRERRLWRWTLLAVVGIYSTLGIVPVLAEWLHNQGLAAAAFLGSMLLIGLTVVMQGLKAKPGGREIGVALGIAAVYIMLFLRLTLPERSHLIEYSVVAVFLYEALIERARQGRRVPLPPLLAIVVTSIIGTTDECIQMFVPNRFFAWEDVLFNVLASLMAVTGMVTLAWAKRLTQRFAHQDEQPIGPDDS